MFKIIILFLLLIGAAWLGWEMNQEGGSILINFRNWQIETSLWAALWLTLFSFMLFYIFLRLIIHGSRFPQQWKTWRKSTRLTQANRAIELAVCEMIEEQWPAAERHFKEAVLSQTFLGYLGAAVAAHHLGANFNREKYFRQALEAAPGSEIILGILLAKLQIHSQQISDATQTLKKLQSSVPNHPILKKLMKEVSDLTPTPL